MHTYVHVCSYMNSLLDILVHLYVAPTPTISFTIQGTVGDQLTIKCRVDADPGVSIVSISWIGPEGSIVNNTRMTINPTIRNGNIFTSRLSFTYLMEDDNDNSYTCNWMILTTSGSQSVVLQLNGKLCV